MTEFTDISGNCSFSKGQDGKVVKTPVFASEGPKFDHRQ